MRLIPFLSQSTIQARVKALGKELSLRLQAVEGHIVLVVVLNGAMRFAMDLVRELEGLEGRVSIESIKAKSYIGVKSSVLRIDNHNIPCKDNHLVLVEDIIDTGHTMSALASLFETSGARSITTVTLLDKPTKRTQPFVPDLTGFVVEDVFVVGYGMDLDGRFRELNYIGQYSEV